MTRRFHLVIPLLTLVAIPLAGPAPPARAYDWEYLSMNSETTTCIEVDAVHDRVFVGTIEGFHYLEQATGVWTNRDWDGWIGRTVYSIMGSEEIDGRVITGRVNAFFKGYIELSDDLGETETLVYSSDGGGVSDLAQDGDFCYACTWPDVSPGEFLRSADGGVSWLLLGGHGHYAMGAVEVGDYGRIFLGGDNRVTMSWDQGLTWEPIGGNLPDPYVYCLEDYYGGGDVLPEISLLAGTDNGLYHTFNYGIWELVLEEGVKNVTRMPVPCGWPGCPDKVVAVTLDGRVLVSPNLGPHSWVDETGNLPGPVEDVAYSPFDRGLYVCVPGHGCYRVTGVVTGVDETPGLSAIAALEVRPNPFNPRARVGITVPVDGPVRLEAFDARGRRVDVLHDAWLVAGRHEIIWQPSDLASGLYLLRLEGNFATRTSRVTLVK